MALVGQQGRCEPAGGSGQGWPVVSRGGGCLEALLGFVVVTRVVGDPAVQQQRDGELDAVARAHAVDERRRVAQQTSRPATLLDRRSLRGIVCLLFGEGQHPRMICDVLGSQAQQACSVNPPGPQLDAEQVRRLVGTPLRGDRVAAGQCRPRRGQEQFRASHGVEDLALECPSAKRSRLIGEASRQQHLDLVGDQVVAHVAQRDVALDRLIQQGQRSRKVSALVDGERPVVHGLGGLEVLSDAHEELLGSQRIRLGSGGVTESETDIASVVERARFPESVAQGMAAGDRPRQVFTGLVVSPDQTPHVATAVQHPREESRRTEAHGLVEPLEPVTRPACMGQDDAQGREDVSLTLVVDPTREPERVEAMP